MKSPRSHHCDTGGRYAFFRLLGFLLLLASLGGAAVVLPAASGSGAQPAAPAPTADLGLRVAPGFKVTLYADHDLANDIYAMTLDAQGRVVVTSEGWIKVLHDTKGAGKADRVTLFAKTKTGGMGMCFDGPDLYFCGDGWFSRYRDTTGKGEADGPPQRIVPMAFNEHGGHAMRKGPDGWWYLIGGNDSRFSDRHTTLPTSPIRNPEAGCLLRLTPDCKQCEVIAQGFRNPYDFDFNEAGDIFTYDSDTERDFFLPWYSPTRMYHIAPGGHHGWRLPGYMRSWCRPDYFLDTVDILWPVGRGSPTGVVCYRHDQFPEHYRGGLFALDWTFGKVYFFPLTPDGATYKTKPEVFLEPTGTNGFAPTDVCVAPDGSLYLTIGGRKTRGAVYRIEYVGDGKTLVKRRPAPQTDLDAVLYAHQPLDAWSRAKWMPLAKKVGAQPFADVVADNKRDEAARVRAVEVLTEVFGGLPLEKLSAGANASSALVRARVAWSLGRTPRQGFAELLVALAAFDPDARVRCQAVTALAERIADLDFTKGRIHPGVVVLSAANLGHLDKRVRQAAARLAARLPTEVWNSLRRELEHAPAQPRLRQAKLSGALATLWRSSQAGEQDGVTDVALSTLDATTDADLRGQALRLIAMALGDYHMKDPPIDAWTGYSLAGSLRGKEAAVSRILKTVRPLFPSGHERLDMELSRLLAMLEDNKAETVRKVAAFWTEKSSPTRDMHYLVVLSGLTGPRNDDLAGKVANTILSLDRKLAGQEQRDKQNWSVRLAEVLGYLLKHDPRLADELVRHPQFVHSAHVALAAVLPEAQRQRAARLFLERVKKDGNFVWSGALIDLLLMLPAEEVRPVLRAQWSDYGLRDAILLQLAKQPEGPDRDKFLFGLDSAQPQVIRACLGALQSLPRDSVAKNLVPGLRLLRRLLQEPKEAALRAQVLALLARQSGEAYAVKEEGTDPVALKRVYQPIFNRFEKQHPDLVALLNSDGDEDPAAWKKLLASVAWEKGNAPRGEAIFKNRACATCHTGPSRLGPDLTGTASRFSRDDLFTAIIYPSLDVAPAYRTTLIETTKGQVFMGIVAFQSDDGVILVTGATTSVRIASTEIAARQPTNKSLMPNGLLKDLKPEDLADLYTYLQTLRPTK
jgi:putative membrane-bound dehydrogenase-like protein